MSAHPGYEPVIGLEIHVQLATKSKMFSSSPNNPDTQEPNTNIDEVVTGQPGTLPVINSEAVRLGVMVGLALNCSIDEYSKFDRKHYFYPDLPKGYQISQYDKPVARNGYLDIVVGGETKRIRIHRAHLEEDAGKNVHPDGASFSLVDYNRAGAPLLEIVTEPDIHSAEEARLFLQELRNIVRYVGASTADMEKGTMRCEPNISVRKIGETALPKYKVEVKNINSFRFAESAINYEIPRQIALLEQGITPKQVTMGWNEKDNVTVEQRSKEEANDYRYFPEPDLPILHFSEEYLTDLRARLPELPAAKRARFMAEYGLSSSDIEQFIAWKAMTEYFEAVVSELQEWLRSSDDKFDEAKLIKQSANWCLGDFTALLNEANQAPFDSRITPENFAELMLLIARGAVSQSAAKTVLARMATTGGEPDAIIADEGLGQVSDTAALGAAVSAVIAAHPGPVEEYRAGQTKVLGFLVGQVMAASGGKANPQVVNELLRAQLGS